jgi:hypothetical protein
MGSKYNSIGRFFDQAITEITTRAVEPNRSLASKAFYRNHGMMHPTREIATAEVTEPTVQLPGYFSNVEEYNALLQGKEIVIERKKGREYKAGEKLNIIQPKQGLGALTAVIVAVETGVSAKGKRECVKLTLRLHTE